MDWSNKYAGARLANMKKKGLEMELAVSEGKNTKKKICKAVGISSSTFLLYRKHARIVCVNGYFGNTTYELEENIK